MSHYLEQINLLRSLQKVDDEIHHIRNELEAAPKEVEDLRTRFEDTVLYRERQQDKTTHLIDQEKRLSTEIDDDAARIKKSKGKLMSVENAREYHAAVREMDSLERVNRNREEERNALADELERQSSALAEIEAEYVVLEKKLAEAEAGLQARIAEAQDKLNVLLLKRRQAGSQVPPPVFARYEFIRERLEHPVIVPVTDGVCSGCHIAIPPQNFIELQKASQILSCPNCQRLMFWSEHFPGEKSFV
ncbi:MAG: C4-type zinc ribbon domain-containing protein [Desulfovibrio sp.]|nr:C4-type zinc ribbon domain-containing protein [Desulfovibrio sp.]